MSYASNFNLNQRVSYLESIADPVLDTLANILLLGNSAGTSDIDMNNNDLLNVNNLNVTTINNAAYPPVISADTLEAVLINGNSAGANSIDMSGNSVLNVATVSSTNNTNINISALGTGDINLNVNGANIVNIDASGVTTNERIYQQLNSDASWNDVQGYYALSRKQTPLPNPIRY